MHSARKGLSFELMQAPLMPAPLCGLRWSVKNALVPLCRLGPVGLRQYSQSSAWFKIVEKIECNSSEVRRRDSAIGLPPHLPSGIPQDSNRMMQIAGPRISVSGLRIGARRGTLKAMIVSLREPRFFSPCLYKSRRERAPAKPSQPSTTRYPQHYFVS